MDQVFHTSKTADITQVATTQWTPTVGHDGELSMQLFYAWGSSPVSCSGHGAGAMAFNGFTLTNDPRCAADHSLDASCERCSAGSYADVGSTICTTCADGTADTDSNPATACENCSVGSYAAAGSTTCTPCSAGSNDIDSNPATPCCERVRYATSLGVEICDRCGTSTVCYNVP